MHKELTNDQVLENALREIAAQACLKGGEWASEQASKTLEFIDRRVPASATA